MRRASNYAVRARRRFCDGKRVAPIDLVLSGKRSIEDWVETLNEERERFRATRIGTEPISSSSTAELLDANAN
jgi:hypothetical protein